MTLLADVFPEIPAPENIVRQICKDLYFIGPLDRQQGKSVETM